MRDTDLSMGDPTLLDECRVSAKFLEAHSVCIRAQWIPFLPWLLFTTDPGGGEANSMGSSVPDNMFNSPFICPPIHGTYSTAVPVHDCVCMRRRPMQTVVDFLIEMRPFVRGEDTEGPRHIDVHYKQCCSTPSREDNACNI